MADPTDLPSGTPPGTPSPADGPGTPRGRRRLGIAAILAAVVVIVIGGLVLAVGGDDGEPTGGTATTAGRTGAARPGGGDPSGVTGASGPTGGTRGDTGRGGRGGTTTTTPRPTVDTVPDEEPDLARIRVVVTPGTCLWNADTLDLTARGSIRNDNPVDAIVSIDVTFRDANGGEVDFASDLAVLNPGEQASWDVLGASIDPPAGGLRCEVALS